MIALCEFARKSRREFAHFLNEIVDVVNFGTESRNYV